MPACRAALPKERDQHPLTGNHVYGSCDEGAEHALVCQSDKEPVPATPTCAQAELSRTHNFNTINSPMAACAGADRHPSQRSFSELLFGREWWGCEVQIASALRESRTISKNVVLAAGTNIDSRDPFEGPFEANPTAQRRLLVGKRSHDGKMSAFCRQNL